jgi:heme-degrading monooxygenase HmoA
MYVMINNSKADPARRHEVDQWVEKEMLPALQKTPGFLANYEVWEGNDHVTVVTTWENEAASTAWMKIFEAENFDSQLGQLGLQFESARRGEAVRHTTAHK